MTGLATAFSPGRLGRGLMIAFLATAGCAAVAPGGENRDLPLRSICIAGDGGPVPLAVEVAETPGQRATGLKHRKRLGKDRGMLFIFGRLQPADRGFWMYRTLIPLDIAYLDQAGTIVAVARMEPCPSADKARCQVYPAGRPFRYAVEVNAGFFRENEIGTGHRVFLDGAECPAPESD